jgi:pSer/pThr/pTyr-binding forkhead associated (FHA) protein
MLAALGGGDLCAHPLPAGVELLIGRDLDCDIVLDHHRVSRRHARLRVACEGDALAIEDLGSRNGTRVGAALEPHRPHPVRAGDPIGIGPFTLTAMRGAIRPLSSLTVEDPLATAPSPGLVAVARGAGSVLVRGEDGAGRRALGEALHRLSARAGRFVAIDCAALGPERLADELFGREDGAARPGALEAAGEGTVLLERIEAVAAGLQPGLLQAVERREVTRAGGAAPVPIAARLVCATQRDLGSLIEAGAFRLDLYYRLAGATLTIRQLRAARGPDEAAERRAILDALDRSGGSQVRAAKLLGMTRGALATKLSDYRLPRPPRARR